jgi:asparagine synthase (glutamine-hydrolysing)
MSLFSGVVALDPTRAIPAQLVCDLHAKLSRVATDRPQLFEGEGFAFAKLDLQVFEGQGWLKDGHGRIALVAGDPLLGERRTGATRHDDLVQLAEDMFSGRMAALGDTHGSFSLVGFDPTRRVLRIATDKLGLRPVYYTIVDGLVIFSSQLRVLAELPDVAKNIDLTGVAQKVALGFALENRTSYANVHLLEPGTMLKATSSSVQTLPYFGWDTIAETTADEKTFSARLFAAFTAAVRRRLGSQSSVVSFFSGGLDSRVVVAVLRALGVETSTINFAGAGSADSVLGRMAAEALQARHFEFSEGPYDFWERMPFAHGQWARQHAAAAKVTRPAQVWTGFAGETVIAPTNITAAMLAAMRAGRIDDAIDGYFSRTGSRLVHRPFTRDAYTQLRRKLDESFRAALARRTCADPGRRFHLHQILNESRGNLADHHDELDLRRIEFIMPFYDPDVVALALSYRLDEFLGHRFYHRWLGEFPPAATSTPWQTYPWSVPCPLPLPAGLRLQWKEGWHTPEDQATEDALIIARAAEQLEDPEFPDWLLSRSTLRFAVWLARRGVRRHMYMFDIADKVMRAALPARAAFTEDGSYTRSPTRKPEVVY